MSQMTQFGVFSRLAGAASSSCPSTSVSPSAADAPRRSHVSRQAARRANVSWLCFWPAPGGTPCAGPSAS
eukprot:9911120-Heterocapsa_arctica.AAC.1